MASRSYPPPADGYAQTLFGPRVPRQGLYGSGPGLFGDGTYSGNIVQGGVTLQPQDYLLDGITPLTQCIVVTGAATVAPNAETGSAVAMGRNLVVVGASAILTASTNAKGLVLLFDAGIYARSGARIHMDKLGKTGNFGTLTAYDLAPAILKARLSQSKHQAYVVLGEGATGALPKTFNGAVAGNAGTAAATMQSGGGGGGGVYTDYGTTATAGRGGKGGPCCGGAGSGGVRTIDGTGTADAGDYGGPGSDGRNLYGDYGGGAGDPVGGGTVSGTGPGGGLLMIFSPVLSVSSGSVMSVAGAAGGGGGTTFVGGGGGGGGCVVVVTRPGGYANSGTVSASGGLGGVGAYASGGAGGAGSINIIQNAA